jgi:hypothetical protein
MEVEEEDALPHPPPGPTLLQIEDPPPLLTIESYTPRTTGGPDPA